MTLQIQRQHHTPYLDYTVPEDMMELSSDVERRFEAAEDVDLDLDLTGEGQSDGEDQHMEEETYLISNDVIIHDQDMLPGNDDEMADDASAGGSAEEGLSVVDENLEDAEVSHSEKENDTIVTTDESDVSNPPSELVQDGVDVEMGKEERLVDKQQNIVDITSVIAHDQEHPHTQSSEYQDQDFNQEQASLAVDNNISGDFSSDGMIHQTLNDNGEPLQEPLPFTEGSLEEDDGEDDALSESCLDQSESISQQSSHNRNDAAEDHPESNDNSHEDGVVDIPLSEARPALNPVVEEYRETPEYSLSKDIRDSTGESVLNGEVHDTDGRDEVTQENPAYIHPVSVTYLESDISLFPSVSQEEGQESTYFLHNTQVTSKSMKHLLKALRSVLGDNIGEQDDLCIEIEDLGLKISESDPESTSTSLKYLIDTYIQLQTFDGVDDPPPLSINLTTKLRFSQQLDYLSNLIAEGKGLSQVQRFEPQEEFQESRHSASAPTSVLESEQAFDNCAVPEDSEATLGKERDRTNIGQDYHTSLLASSEMNGKNVDYLDADLKPDDPTRRNFDSEGHKDFIEVSKTNDGVEGQRSQAKHISKTDQNPSAIAPMIASPQKTRKTTLYDGDTIEYDEEEDQEDQESVIETPALLSTLVDASPSEANDYSEAASHDQIPPKRVETSDATAQSRDPTEVATMPRIKLETVGHASTSLPEENQNISGVASGRVVERKDAYADEPRLNGQDEKSLNLEQHVTTNGHRASTPTNIREDELAAYTIDQAALSHSAAQEGSHSPTKVGVEQISAHIHEESGDHSIQITTDQPHYETRSSVESAVPTSVETGLGDSHPVERQDEGPMYESTRIARDDLEALDPPVEDEDEITFEDDEEDEDSWNQHSHTEPKVNASPAYLKRSRLLYEDDITVEDEKQDVKRVRPH